MGNPPGQDVPTPAVAEDNRSIITALQASPGRVVLTEENNCDGWIAADSSLLESLKR